MARKKDELSIEELKLLEAREARAADAVAQTIHAYARRGLPLRAVMLSKLGPNVWHDSPAAAMAILEELEETARLWWMVQRQAMPLDAAAISQLLATFDAKW